MLDGKAVKTLKLTASNNDLLHQFVFKGIDAHQPASIQLQFEGAGESCVPGGRPLLYPVG